MFQKDASSCRIYQVSFFFLFLGGRGGRQEGGASSVLENFAQQWKVVVENIELKEMSNHHLCKARMDMVPIRTEGREGRSC